MKLSHWEANTLTEAADLLSQLSCEHSDVVMTSNGKNGYIEVDLFLISCWLHHITEIAEVEE